MSTRTRLLALCAGLLAWTGPALQADETAAPATPATPAAAPEATAGPLEELGALNARIQARIESGPQSSDDFAPETEAFAALVEKYADDRSPEAAQLNFMHAAYTIQILRDIDGGAKILAHVAATFPETEAGQQAATVLAQFQAQQEREEAAANLVGNPAPELHFDWASEDNLKTLSDLRGKVVVLDFWATWCGPCIRSFPDVRELTDHYAGSAVEVVGVTSVQGKVHGLEAAPVDASNDPAKEYALTADFAAKYEVTWPVVFTTEKVFNPDYGVNGIPHMAIIAPDGTVRHNGLHPSMPLAEKVELIDAILREFELAAPATPAAE